MCSKIGDSHSSYNFSKYLDTEIKRMALVIVGIEDFWLVDRMKKENKEPLLLCYMIRGVLLLGISLILHTYIRNKSMFNESYR